MESSPSPNCQVVTIDRSTRWQAFQRLQELEIPCICSSDGTLLVETNTLVAIVQVQSVIRQLTAGRLFLAGQLERCWNLPTSPEF